MFENGHSVIVKNGNIENALRRFKNKMKAANLYMDLKKNEQYVKPSQLKKEAKNRGKRRAYFDRMKQEAKENKKV